MHPIDPVLAGFIDSVAEGAPSTELQERWLAGAARFREELQARADFACDQEEADRLERLPALVGELEDAVRQPADPDTLVERALRFYSELHRFEEGRERLRFAGIEALDELIAVATAASRAPEAVERRLPRARASVAEVKALFRPQAFPQEFAAGVERGFGLLEEALSDADVPRLKEGARLVSRFVQAVRDERQQTRLNVPVIGALLQNLELENDPALVKLLRTRGWPRLVALWNGTRDGWLLPPSQAPRLLAGAEAALESFSAALERFEEDEEAFWEAVGELDSAFTAVRSAGMPVDRLLNSSLGPEAALLLALLEGKAPRYVARTAVEAMRAGDVPGVIERLADGLEEYLRTSDSTVLLGLLEMLLAASRE